MSLIKVLVESVKNVDKMSCDTHFFAITVYQYGWHCRDPEVLSSLGTKTKFEKSGQKNTVCCDGGSNLVEY